MQTNVDFLKNNHNFYTKRKATSIDFLQQQKKRPSFLERLAQTFSQKTNSHSQAYERTSYNWTQPSHENSELPNSPNSHSSYSMDPTQIIQSQTYTPGNQIQLRKIQHKIERKNSHSYFVSQDNFTSIPNTKHPIDKYDANNTLNNKNNTNKTNFLSTSFNSNSHKNNNSTDIYSSSKMYKTYKSSKKASSLSSLPKKSFRIFRSKSSKILRKKENIPDVFLQPATPKSRPTSLNSKFFSSAHADSISNYQDLFHPQDISMNCSQDGVFSELTNQTYSLQDYVPKPLQLRRGSKIYTYRKV